MSRHTNPTRGVGAFALVGLPLALASCSLPLVAQRATGQPSLSLGAPLTTVGCAATGSCVALGASGSAVAPTAAGQVRNRKGVWSPLRVPAAPLASFDAASCAATTCLFGGTGSGADLLWRVDPGTGAVAPKKGPPGGLVIRDLSCASDLRCAAIDQAANGLARISFTTTGARTWSPPRTLAWVAHATTTLDCPGAKRCYLAASSTRPSVTVRETLNGGLTWKVVATPATWRSLAGLQCAFTCTALASAATGSLVATQSVTPATTTVAAKTVWKATPVRFHASALACAGSSPCLVVGANNAQGAAMAQFTAGAVQNVALTYVPSALLAVACQPSACVAIGVSTVVTLRP